MPLPLRVDHRHPPRRPHLIRCSQRPRAAARSRPSRGALCGGALPPAWRHLLTCPRPLCPRSRSLCAACLGEARGSVRISASRAGCGGLLGRPPMSLGRAVGWLLSSQLSAVGARGRWQWRSHVHAGCGLLSPADRDQERCQPCVPISRPLRLWGPALPLLLHRVTQGPCGPPQVAPVSAVAS